MITAKAGIANFTGNTALTASVSGGGILYLIGQNAPAIGAIVVTLGLAFGVYFKWKAHRETVRHNKAVEAKLTKPTKKLSS